MFLRHKIRKKVSKRHRYRSVVENKRVTGGRVVPKYVLHLHLGEINDLQELACGRLLRNPLIFWEDSHLPDFVAES